MSFSGRRPPLQQKAEADLERLRQENEVLRAQREDFNREIDRKLAENERQQGELQTFIKLAALYMPVAEAANHTTAVPDQDATGPTTANPAAAPNAPGRATDQATTEPAVASPPAAQRPPVVRVPRGTMIRAADVCVDILRQTGRPWRTRELLAELERRGVAVGGLDPASNLSNRLGQCPDKVRSHNILGWHLAEWPDFPVPDEERIAGLRAQIQEDADAKRRALPKPATLTEAKKRAFYGMSVPDAAISVLSERERPVGNVEIASALEEAGFPFKGNLVGAIETSLRRRLDSTGEVARAAPIVRVAPGTWGLASWYTDEEIKQFAEKLAGQKMPGRDYAAHKMSVQAAVQAALVRGARFGRRPKLNDEQTAIAKQMAAAGAAAKDIAGAFGVTSATVVRWKKKWAAAER
jgi:hypothetical protein